MPAAQPDGKPSVSRVQEKGIDRSHFAGQLCGHDVSMASLAQESIVANATSHERFDPKYKTSEAVALLLPSIVEFSMGQARASVGGSVYVGNTCCGAELCVTSRVASYPGGEVFKEREHQLQLLVVRIIIPRLNRNAIGHLQVGIYIYPHRPRPHR